MKKKIFIISSFFIFLILVIFYLIGFVNGIDNFVYDIVISIKSDTMTNIMKFITFFASTKFIIIVMIFLFILSRFKGKVPLIINYLILGEVFINNLVKLIIRRDRPELINLVTETSFSFPSGHTMVAVVLYGFLIYLINKSKISKKLKIVGIGILSILIIIIMLSRIYLGVHYFSDVLAGFFLSLGYLLLMIDILERRNIL